MQKGNNDMILLKNVRPYDKSADVQDILICGRDIIEIAPNIDVPERLIEQTIDGGGLVAAPGYIDQHVHITGGGGEGGFSNQVPPLKLSQLVDAGVTTVVGLLGTDGTTRSVANLVAKTKAFNEEGWTAYCLTGSYWYPTHTLTGSVIDDITFIQEIIGVKVAISDHRGSGITKDELTRLGHAARMGGMLSGKAGIVHLHTGSGEEELRKIIDIVKTSDLPVSVFRPTHLSRHMDQAVEFASLGGYIDFTAGTNPSYVAGILNTAFSRAPKDRVTLSSDGNGSLPMWNEKKELIGITAGRVSADHDVICAMVNEFSYKYSDAIRVLTENPAKALKLYPYKGLLAAGSCADILLLSDTLAIDTVIANGKLFKLHGKSMYTPKFE